MLAFVVFVVAAGAAATSQPRIPPPPLPEWQGWSLLSSREPRGHRIAGRGVPPSPHYIQASYDWDNFVQQVDAPEKNVAYGCVLNGHRRYNVTGRGKDTECSYGGVLVALEFALRHVPAAVGSSEQARWQWPQLGPRSAAAALAVADYQLLDAFVQPLRFTHDGKTHTAVEVEEAGRFNGAQGAREHRITFGARFYLNATVWLRAGQTGRLVPSQHTFIVFYDMARRLIMNTHTFRVGQWPPVATALSQAKGLRDSKRVADPAHVEDISIGVYNVWNSNPPSWVFRGPERWRKYWQRMHYLADTIAAESPPIITFQVRVSGRACAGMWRPSHDLSHTCAGGAVRHWS